MFSRLLLILDGAKRRSRLRIGPGIYNPNTPYQQTVRLAGVRKNDIINICGTDITSTIVIVKDGLEIMLEEIGRGYIKFNMTTLKGRLMKQGVTELDIKVSPVL